MKNQKPNNLHIRLYGDKTLREVAKPVTEFTDEVKDFIADLTFTMYEKDGVGLAAPQVGKSLRIFVVDPLWFNEEGKKNPLVLVNPEFKEFEGEVWLLNVWASWCRACITEHPVLEQLSSIEGLTMVGMNYKDIRADGKAWLNRYGDPFDTVLFDQQGGAGIDWGVYGVPETFIMDKQGKIRYKHIGPISNDDLKDTLMPLIESLKAGQG